MTINWGTLIDPEYDYEELLALAREALESLEARKDEDIEEWAARIARDVYRADD